MIVAPLAFYALAAASRLIGRALRGQGGWLKSRIALFWSLLSTAPIELVAGAASMLPFEFAPIASNALSWVAAGAFAIIWTFAIMESENPP